ncbi:MAG: 50S ribosomal protein L21 [Chloroflexota bacterium]
MKYAVIRTGGKQYRVSEGGLVKIEKLAGEVGEKVTLPEVLFVGGDEVKIGAALILILHFGPSAFDLFVQPLQFVVTAAGKDQQSGD